MDMAKMLAESELVPAHFRKKPGSVIAAWTLGSQLGLSLFSSLQHIMVINGRPTLWGDGALAVVRAHPDFVDIREGLDGEGDSRIATCTVWRRGSDHPTIRTFSVHDAKRAKLWGKSGPWTQYPDRMLQMRARGFAIRDAFADALCGCGIAEEERDVERNITEQVVVRSRPAVSRTEQVLRQAQAAVSATEPSEVELLMGAMADALSYSDLLKVAVKVQESSISDEDQQTLRAAFALRRDELRGEPSEHTDDAEEREESEGDPGGFDPDADADMVGGR